MIEQKSQKAFMIYEEIGHTWIELYSWLTDNFKPEEYSCVSKGSSLHVIETMLEFKNMEDAAAFKLRWHDGN